MSTTRHFFQIQKHSRNNSGVTLVELMIAVAVSGFVIAAIYMSFKAQQHASFTQDEVASMQQNLRAAANLMSSEIRMAGYDPTGNAKSGIDTTAALTNSASIHFTKDDSGTADGDVTDPDEDITYSLYTSGAIQCLGRKAPNVNSCVAENIDHLNFQYLDSSGLPTTNISDVTAVKFSIIARARNLDSNFANNTNYTSANGTTINYGGDGYRRRQLTMTVQGRNLGL